MTAYCLPCVGASCSNIFGWGLSFECVWGEDRKKAAGMHKRGTMEGRRWGTGRGVMDAAITVLSGELTLSESAHIAGGAVTVSL